MKITETFLIILPVAIVWLLTPLFILVYAFDVLSVTFQIDITQSIFNLGILILVLTTFLASISLYITGHLIDKNPQLLKPLITGSLLASGIFLFLVVVGVDFVIFLLIGLPFLGISLGILATGAGALYGGYTDVHHRGRVYAGAIFLSAMVSLFILVFSEVLNWDFEIPLLLIGCIAILLALIFYFLSQPISPWVNDEFPTPIGQILGRRSVRTYLVSRFFIYLMLGVAFATISQIGQVRYSDLLLNLPFFGLTTFDHSTIFWIIVFFADLVCVIPMGWFSDRFSRKNLIVMGVYGIVIAALIVGLSENPLMYYFSAYLLGVSFASFHPSLDSAVWADISPLDSLGRYYALSFIFLLQGVGFGFLIGIFLLPQSTSGISYVLIGIAVLGLFPLFFVADSYNPLEIYLLLIASSGMCMFSYEFDQSAQSRITQKDIILVAGALSAISAFFEGLSDQPAVLDLVRHGQVFTVQTKAGTEQKELIATVFANKIDPELKNSLDSFLARFCLSFHDEINDWIGQASVFDPAVEIAEEVFGPLIPSKTSLRSPRES